MNKKRNIFLLILAFTFFITGAKCQVLQNINITDYQEEARLLEADTTLRVNTIAILSDRKKEVIEQEDEYPRIFWNPEQMPQFPGGDVALMKYIASNLRPIYPFVEGQVILRFIVDKDSTIQKAKVIRSLSEEADAEALRVINSMPKWIPGKINDKDIAMSYTLPVRFKLAKPKKEKRQKTKSKNKMKQ